VNIGLRYLEYDENDRVKDVENTALKDYEYSRLSCINIGMHRDTHETLTNTVYVSGGRVCIYSMCISAVERMLCHPQ
jgi:hypothetical protein